jgi:hypothetical protein
VVNRAPVSGIHELAPRSLNVAARAMHSCGGSNAAAAAGTATVAADASGLRCRSRAIGILAV